MSDSSESANGVSCPACKNREVGYEYQKDGYRIFGCPDCGLKLVHPQPGEEELAKIYDSSYFQRGGKYFQQSESETRKRNLQNNRSKIDLVLRHKQEGRLLDLGCAMGGFLELAKQNGFEVEGLELSTFSAEYVERELSIKVYNSDLLSTDIPDNSFDVVTMWDVVEHLKNPVETIERIQRILRPGGFLLLSTGDIGSLYARITGKRWHLMTPPQHLFFFTAAGISRIFKNNGLLVEEILYPGKQASIEFILFKARETIGFLVKPLEWLARLLRIGQLRVHVNIRDIMTCVAKKPD